MSAIPDLGTAVAVRHSARALTEWPATEWDGGES
jgi:hypothetical protein